MNDVLKTTLSSDEHRTVARLCAVTGVMLLQHGAESALAESLTRRLGLALGAGSVEVALMANAITVTTIVNGECITTVRRNQDRGINMYMVMEVQRSVLAVEEGTMDAEAYRRSVENITPHKYPRRLTTLAVGIACACFARLAGADGMSVMFAFVSGTAGMAMRHLFGHFNFSPMIGFFAAAFVATSITAQDFIYHISTTPKISMSASVLLLVPGFPLVNGVSDIVKGYANTGIARVTTALLLLAMSCIGIMLGVAVWGTKGWL